MFRTSVPCKYVMRIDEGTLLVRGFSLGACNAGSRCVRNAETAIIALRIRLEISLNFPAEIVSFPKTSKQRIVVRSKLTIHSGPWLGFKVWGKYIIRGADFAFIICFNKKNSGHNKFGEVRTKMWEVLPTNASPWLRAWIHLFHTRNKVNFSAIFSQRHGCLKYSKSVMQTVSRLMCKLFQWFPSQPRLLFFVV